MAQYKVTGPDGAKYLITAPDDATEAQVMMRARIEAAKANGVSPEVVERQREINKRTGIEARPSQTQAGILSAAQGASFGTADEISSALMALTQDGGFSENYDKNLELARSLVKQGREDYPVTSTLSEVGGALPMAVALPWAAAGSKGALLPRMMKSGGVAGAEGAAYGFAAGEGGAGDRAINAATTAPIAGAIGAVAPPVAQGLGSLAKSLLTRKASKSAGVSPAAYDALARNVEAGVDERVLSDPSAMLVDTSPAFAGLMDTAIQKSGPAGAKATQAVDDRVYGAARSVDQALDDYLGIPGESTSRAVVPYGQPNPLRGLYQNAYSKPIDYTSQAGIQIEEMVKNRVPPEAIAAANKLMRLDGAESQQIAARIADDGTVTFERLPDVMQLDYITRGLNQVSESSDGSGALGGKTPLGAASGRLANEIRTNLRLLVPEWGNAVDAARSIIRSGKAREAGETALRPSITRSDLAETLQSMTDSEKLKVREGMRMYIDDALANVKRTAGDDDVAAREARKALMDLSSKSARTKIEMVIGARNAAGLFRQLDSAARAFNLRANVAGNSRTFGRLATDQGIQESISGGAVNALREGRPIATAQDLTAALLGRTQSDKARLSDEAYSDIVAALLQRGPQAMDTLNAVRQAPAKVNAPAANIPPLVRRLLSGSGVALSEPTARGLRGSAR